MIDKIQYACIILTIGVFFDSLVNENTDVAIKITILVLFFLVTTALTIGSILETLGAENENRDTTENS